MNAKKFFFILVGVSCISVVLLGGAIYFGNSIISKKAKAISEVNTDTDLVETKVADTAKLAKKIQLLADVADISDKFLPVDKDQTTLLAELFSIAKTYGIELTNVSFNATTKGPSTTSQTEEVKDAPGVRVYPFVTGIECVSYDRFIGFLERVELNKRKAQIVSMNIRPIETGSESCPAGNISVSNVKIEVYLKNEGQTPTTDVKNK